MQMDFEKMDAAGVLDAHLAQICKVSRTAVHFWRSGKNVGPKHAGRVKQVVDLVDRAVQSGRLPLSQDVRAGDRFDELAKALVATSKEASEPTTDE